LPVLTRERVRRFVETPGFQRTIMTIIVVNAVLLGLETSPHLSERATDVLHALDRLALAIFVVELSAKLYAYGWRFFQNAWNVFDLVIVGVALVPGAGPFAVLRSLRLLRMLRLISAVPSMRRVVATLLAAMPGAGAIVGLLSLVIYVSAVMATSLFGAGAPEHFGDLGESLWTLFQTLTGEAWPDIADDVMAVYPMAWIFFLVFILISTFVVLNLFLAVIVSAMESVKDTEEAEVESALKSTEADILAEIAALRRDVAELPALRRELAALRGLLTAGVAAGAAAEDPAESA
jgi:voltage-gated sodium channel